MTSKKKKSKKSKKTTTAPLPKAKEDLPKVLLIGLAAPFVVDFDQAVAFLAESFNRGPAPKGLPVFLLGGVVEGVGQRATPKEVASAALQVGGFDVTTGVYYCSEEVLKEVHYPQDLSLQTKGYYEAKTSSASKKPKEPKKP